MSNINELFVQETVDPRIENVMPILSKLQKKISEMSEVNELSEWADKLIEGDEDIEDNEADDAADNAESELTEAPGAETLGHNVRTDAKNMRAFDLEETHPAVRQLKNKLGQVAKQNPGSGLGKHYDNIKNGMTYKDLVRKGMVDQNGKIDIPGFKDEMEEAVRAGFVTPDWKHTPQQGAYGAPTDQLGRPYNQAQRDELAASVKQNRKDNKAFSGGLPTKGADSAAFGWDGVWKAPDVKNTGVRAQQDTGTDNPKKWKTLASAGDGKGIAEEESLTSNNPQGVPESEEHSPVAQAITRKILTQRTDLLKKYGPVKVMQAIDSASEFFGDVEEIGSSDMYAYMQYVEKELGNVDEGMMDTVEKGVKALDRFVTGGDKEDLIKKLQKDAGIPSHAQHGKPNMAKPKEEEVDESALQAYLGDKKYGEDGMDALRKAGQEHASEKTMQNIRAKYSKKEEPVKEGNGDTEIHPGMKVSQGTVVKVNGNTVTVKTSNGDMMNMNIHDVDQAVAEGEFAGDYATGEAGQWRNKGPKANKPATIGDLVGEGTGNLAKAISKLGGWYQEDSLDPNIEKFEYDDREGGYYASGSIEHNLKTGEIEIHFQDSESDEDIDGTFNSIGDAMNALRGGYPGSHGGRAQNYDSLANKTLFTPDDVYKTDRAGKKGTLSKSRMDGMKASSAYTMRGGPKGVLPEGQDDLDTIRRLVRK
jgi:uncharacterized protein YjgD (DUF1641 family)